MQSTIFDNSTHEQSRKELLCTEDERELASKLIRIRLSLFEYSISHSLEELLQKTLDEVCDLTGSHIGFYHFVEDDQKTLTLQAWSTRTMKEFCRAEGKGMHYGIDKAGVWTDCVRERKPVIHNDYASLPHRKGMPEGHATVIRELVVPIMRSDKIVAILGIGNKPENYTEKDIEIVSYLADIAWEIAEHKRTEKEVRRQHNLQQKIFDLLPVGLWIADKDGKLLYGNPAVMKIWGAAPRVGQEEYGLFRARRLPSGEEVAPDDWALAHSINEGVTIKDEMLEIDAFDGSKKIILNYTAPVFDDAGKIDGAIVVNSNITDLKQAEEDAQAAAAETRRLLENAEKSRRVLLSVVEDQKIVEEVLSSERAQMLSIFDSMEAVVDVVDLQTYEVLFMNKYTSDLFGQSGVGKSCYQVFHNYDAPCSFCNNEKLLQGGEDEVVRWEYFSEPFGRYFTTMNKRLKWPDGRKAKIELSIDITDRKRAEKELEKLNAELEQRVLERTALLETANKELEAFSYSVSHDLRSPLQHLTGYTQLLEKRAAGILDDKNKHYLKAIADSAIRMGKLIEDLLSFSRMGRAEMMKRKTNLDSLVKEILRDLQSDSKERAINWKISPLPEVYCDTAMLRLVFINLVSNAFKFTKTRTDAVIEIGSTIGEKGEVCVFVKDNGAGFDMKYVDKLFGVFQRLHRAEEFEGTGIGLANVQRIINRHGGRVWAEGKVGEGATFFFTVQGSGDSSQ